MVAIIVVLSYLHLAFPMKDQAGLHDFFPYGERLISYHSYVFYLQEHIINIIHAFFLLSFRNKDIRSIGYVYLAWRVIDVFTFVMCADKYPKEINVVIIACCVLGLIWYHALKKNK